MQGGLDLACIVMRVIRHSLQCVRLINLKVHVHSQVDALDKAVWRNVVWWIVMPKYVCTDMYMHKLIYNTYAHVRRTCKLSVLDTMLSTWSFLTLRNVIEIKTWCWTYSLLIMYAWYKRGTCVSSWESWVNCRANSGVRHPFSVSCKCVSRHATTMSFMQLCDVMWVQNVVHAWDLLVHNVLHAYDNLQPTSPPNLSAAFPNHSIRPTHYLLNHSWSLDSNYLRRQLNFK